MRRRTSGFAAIATVLVVVIGVWLADGRGPGSPTQDADRSSSTGQYAGGTDTDSGLRVVELRDLPEEARETVREIDHGGPYPYTQDGTTFGNYERVLPIEPHGYYTEFTVDTPGAADRAARRIIRGEDGALYWTADHYVSFASIRR